MHLTKTSHNTIPIFQYLCAFYFTCAWYKTLKRVSGDHILGFDFPYKQGASRGLRPLTPTKALPWTCKGGLRGPLDPRRNIFRISDLGLLTPLVLLKVD